MRTVLESVRKGEVWCDVEGVSLRSCPSALSPLNNINCLSVAQQDIQPVSDSRKASVMITERDPEEQVPKVKIQRCRPMPDKRWSWDEMYWDGMRWMLGRGSVLGNGDQASHTEDGKKARQAEGKATSRQSS